MSWKFWISAIVIIIPLTLVLMFFQFPKGLSIIFSYKVKCQVKRVETFMKGMVLNGSGQQMNKFSIVCSDGLVCRAEDTGFAGVKTGDNIEFRAFPEFSNIEEFGKCDHAQLIRIQP